MPARRKLNVENIRNAMNVICPQCGASIAPDQQTRIDFEKMKCPQCGNRFIPAKPKAPDEL